MPMRALAIQTIILIILALIILIAGIAIISKLSSSADKGISRLENITTSTASDILGRCALLSSSEIVERCIKACDKHACSYRSYRLSKGKILCICLCHISGNLYNKRVEVDC